MVDVTATKLQQAKLEQANLEQQKLEQQKLGKYLIKRVLGKGAMGVVYLGYDPDICRPVAIKTLHENILCAEEGGEFLSRFKTEAQAVGRLMHQNIVAIYDFDLQHSPPYFVMEYCPGVELKKLILKQGALEVDEAINIIGQILDALQYSHQMGIIHRDIKPANIFVQEDGRVKLADFGIAHLDTSDLTRMGMVLGTPSYMSPEQAQAQEIDSRSDLFSTAAVLYEMVTGRKAFKGDNPAATLHQVVHRQPVDIQDAHVELPLALNQVLMKALAKKITHRYDSAESFKTALINLLKEKPTQEASVAPLFKMIFGGSVGLVLVICVGFLLHSNEWFDQKGSNLDVQMGFELKPAYPFNILPVIDAADLVIEPDRQERRKVQRLLEVAGAHFMVNRLISPQGSNAYDTYLLVLGRDPRNKKAIEGLSQVAQAYIEQCDALLRKGYVEDVIQRLEAGRKFFPGYAPLMERIEKIEANQSLN